MKSSFVLRQPDDWHVHLRDGAILQGTVKAAGRYFGRSIVMPNLDPPLVSLAEIQAYQQRIMMHIPANSTWRPLMTLYLTDQTTPEHIAQSRPLVVAAKLYPAGATTNSQAGVRAVKKLYPVFATMAELGMPLLLHGEVTEAGVDIFDREAVFIERVLRPIVASFPHLKIVLEHITTKDAVDFVTESSTSVAATITPQHLLYNRNHLLAGGIRPHLYCLPILKREQDRAALRKAATSGNPQFFLGTDSAPHAKVQKESCCGCAGCFSGYGALEIYAQIFEDLGALDALQGFASDFGANFYALARNERQITLVRQSWVMPERVILGGTVVIPLCAGVQMRWRVFVDK